MTNITVTFGKLTFILLTFFLPQLKKQAEAEIVPSSNLVEVEVGLRLRLRLGLGLGWGWF